MTNKITADSEHDYGVTIQAKAIFQLAAEHIKKALKTPLINKGQTEPFRTYYVECEHNIEGLDKYRRTTDSFARSTLGTNLIIVTSSDFIKGTSYKDFAIVFAMWSLDMPRKRTNSWNGFFTQRGIAGLPTITLYCEYELPERKMGFMQAGELAEKYKSALNVNMAKLKSTFIHEFGHNYNFLQWVDKAEQINKRGGNKPAIPNVKYQSPPAYDGGTPTEQQQDQYEKYVNDPQEVNARYLEWIHAIQTSFTRLLRIKNADYDIRKVFKTFHDFWDFYWTTDGFVPVALKDHANMKTKKKLARRLYGFYMFLVENPASNPNEVENFIRDQMRKDVNTDYTTPVPQPKPIPYQKSEPDYELAKG